MRRIFSELKKAGYAYNQRVPGEGGRWTTVMHVSDRPDAEALAKQTASQLPSESDPKPDSESDRITDRSSDDASEQTPWPEDRDAPQHTNWTPAESAGVGGEDPGDFREFLARTTRETPEEAWRNEVPDVRVSDSPDFRTSEPPAQIPESSYPQPESGDYVSAGRTDVRVSDVRVSGVSVGRYAGDPYVYKKTDYLKKEEENSAVVGEADDQTAAGSPPQAQSRQRLRRGSAKSETRGLHTSSGKPADVDQEIPGHAAGRATEGTAHAHARAGLGDDSESGEFSQVNGESQPQWGAGAPLIESAQTADSIAFENPAPEETPDEYRARLLAELEQWQREHQEETAG